MAGLALLPNAFGAANRHPQCPPVHGLHVESWRAGFGDVRSFDPEFSA